MRIFALALLSLLLPASLCSAASGSPGVADPYAAMKSNLSKYIRKEMSLNSVKGLSMAVVDGQRVIWCQGFGYADEATKTLAAPDTVYRAGSISKVVTSMRVLQLAGEKRLGLDDDIRSHVPEFSIRNRFPNTPPITPRMLMSHRSGLPTDVVAGMWAERPMTLAQYIPTLSRESMASPPATQWRYSNVAYSLLGRMIEKIEGRAFAEDLRLGLLGPLGMRDSGYVLTEELARRFATGYRGGKPAPAPTLRDQPTGSLYTTVEDLAAFMAAVFADGAGVIPKDGLRESMRPQFPGLPLDFGHLQGLGWMLSGVTLADGRPVAWHGGTAIPFQAFLAVEPETKLGVAILANSEEASRFASDLAVKALDMAMEVKTGRAAPLPPRPAKPKGVQLSPEELASYAGDYATFAGQFGSIWLDGDDLKMWLLDREVELMPLGKGRFLPRKEAMFGLATRVMPDLSLEYRVVEGREVMVLLGHAMPAPFEKMPHRPVPDAWLRRLGTYVTDAPGEGICYKGLELALKDGLLTAAITVSTGVAGTPTAEAVFPLVVVSDSEAVIGGIGTGTGAVVRAEGDGLYHSGYDFRPVR
jgi:CubicO group peptidase (beta-lactamase class C family)